MSGHSKWSQIKHQKGAADVRRGKVFSKLASQIAIAARQGGGNPEMNSKLRLAIAAARAANMPKENVDRAIKRGTGELGGAQIEELTFEGYGPGGVAIIVKAVSDNRNRTTSDVRSTFNKFGGRMGEGGTVGYLFELRGTIILTPASEELELAAIDAGAVDIEPTDDSLVVTTAPTELFKLKEALEASGATVESAELGMVPKTTVAFSNPEFEKHALQLLEALDELDDVTDVSSNGEFGGA